MKVLNTYLLICIALTSCSKAEIKPVPSIETLLRDSYRLGCVDHILATNHPYTKKHVARIYNDAKWCDVKSEIFSLPELGYNVSDYELILRKYK